MRTAVCRTQPFVSLAILFEPGAIDGNATITAIASSVNDRTFFGRLACAIRQGDAELKRVVRVCARIDDSEDADSAD